MRDRLAATVMLQGSSSSVGKSFLAAGLCRLYARRGLRVAPFKAQNMALNAAVTPEGAEIGRAQAVQAEAAGVLAEAAMNPILLKAERDSSCQVIFMGKPIGSYSAAAYRAMRADLWPGVKSALQDLRRRFDLVVLEGAGSPAEVNLREGEIVNMRVAAAADAPVLLVGDLERGGIFAALLGTLSLLRPAERQRVKGLVVNRFRGDTTLFAAGVDFLQRKSRLPVLGVVPYLDSVRLPAEDSLDLESFAANRRDALLDVAVVQLGRISNFDEFQPLKAEADVGVRLVADPEDLGRPDLVIVPGTKTTAQDLARLRQTGMAAAIVRAREGGAAVLGICGGYQILGRRIDDPSCVEWPGNEEGLGLLPTETVFDAKKLTVQREGRVVGRTGLLAQAGDLCVRGYEIRMGRVHGETSPALDLGDHFDGCVSEDGWVMGTSVHGLLANQPFRRALLEAIARRKGVVLHPTEPDPSDPFEVLADALEQCLEVEKLDRIIGVRAG